MGNTNPIAVMAGKNQAAEKQEQLADGINTLTGANKTAEQLAQVCVFLFCSLHVVLCCG